MFFQLEGEEVSEVQGTCREQEDAGDQETRWHYVRHVVAQAEIKAKEQERLKVLEAKMQVPEKKSFLFCTI